MDDFDYDLLVLGAGSGGVRASRMAAQLGAKVGLCEQGRVGGTCVLRGCVPKKLLLYAARFADAFADAAGFGWSVPPARLDWPRLIKAKNLELDRLTGLYQQTLARAGVQLIEGQGRLQKGGGIVVGGRSYRARHLLIATGGWPYLPPIPGIEHAISSNEALDLPQLPKRMLVVGGGYIAVELAGVFNAVGVEVTQVIRADKLLRGFDADLRSRVGQAMQQRGVKLLPCTQVVAIEKVDTAKRVRLDNGDALTVDCVLYATGRRPASAHLGTEELGLGLSPEGAIKVDQAYRTNIAGVYALGDVTDRVCLTPVAIEEAMVLVRRLFGGEAEAKLDYSNIPTAVFSQPPLACVGLAEDQLPPGSFDVYQSEFRPMKNTLAGRDERSFLKLLVDRASNRVLGAHMLGDDAPEIMQGFATALVAGATKAQFDATVGIHPTAAEEFVTLRDRRS